ncbi:IclR family transcriptional regulator [Sulfitobacter sp.]|uniref:IclR family transcriptional regulator n=1 Tax=Sulfitobacter sp. TaxID=1903071 RepID=UPI0030025D85
MIHEILNPLYGLKLTYMDIEPQISPKRGDGAQTVLRAADVLRLVGRLRSARFSDLARESGLPNPTLRRLLVSLIEAQLVHHDKEQARYRLGSEAYVLGQLARPDFGFHDLARDSLARLAVLSGDCAFLSALEGLSTVCLHREEGQYPIRTHVLNVGDRHPLGLGAAALAILSILPDAEVEDILNANAESIRKTRAELDVPALLQQVADARATGVALNPGLVFPGSWAIAAAIRAPSGEILGALTIAAIESRMTPERQKELTGPLLDEVQRIEKLLAKFGSGGLSLGKKG